MWLSLSFKLLTSWVAIQFVVCESVCLSGICNTQPNLNFHFWYIQAFITTLYPQVPTYTDQVLPSNSWYHFIIHYIITHSWANWIFTLFTNHLMSHALYTWSRCTDWPSSYEEYKMPCIYWPSLSISYLLFASVDDSLSTTRAKWCDRRWWKRNILCYAFLKYLNSSRAPNSCSKLQKALENLGKLLSGNQFVF